MVLVRQQIPKSASTCRVEVEMPSAVESLPYWGTQLLIQNTSHDSVQFSQMDEGTVGTFVFPPLGHLFYDYLYMCVLQSKHVT